MVDPFGHANEEHDEIYKAVKTFAAAIGCEMSEEGGKKFARIVMVAVAEAAFEGGDIFEGVARKLIVLRPKHLGKLFC
jgi:hypothetical protein